MSRQYDAMPAPRKAPKPQPFNVEAPRVGREALARYKRERRASIKDETWGSHPRGRP
jgi:hypothetical protein